MIGSALPGMQISVDNTISAPLLNEKKGIQTSFVMIRRGSLYVLSLRSSSMFLMKLVLVYQLKHHWLKRRLRERYGMMHMSKKKKKKKSNGGRLGKDKQIYSYRHAKAENSADGLNLIGSW